MVYIDEYFTYLKYQNNLSSLTIKGYELDLKQYTRYANKQQCDSTSEDCVQAYVEFLTSKYKLASVKRHVVSLKKYFNYLIDINVIKINPCENIGIGISDISESIIVPIKVDVLQLIMKAAEKEIKLEQNPAKKMAALRDYCIFQILICTGLNPYEIVSLKMKDISMENKTILVTKKTSRIIGINNKDLWQAIQNFFDFKRQCQVKNEYLFLNKYDMPLSSYSVNNISKRYCSLAGIEEKYTPRDFRHTFAKRLLAETNNAMLLKDVFGYKSLCCLEKYEEDIKNIIRL